MLLDVIYAILCSWGVYKGFSKGFILYFFSFLGFIFGVVIALKFTYVFAVYLQDWFQLSSEYVPFIAFLVLFIGIIVLVRLLSAFLEGILEFLYLNIFNKMAGALLGGVLFTFLFSMGVWFCNQVNLISPHLKLDSVTYPYVAPVFPTLMDYGTAVFMDLKELFQDLAYEPSTKKS